MSVKDFKNQLSRELSTMKFTRTTFKDYFIIILGVTIQAFAMRLFLVPAYLVSGGVSGAAQLINHLLIFQSGGWW
jgi:uncharacterized membrane-anchored protein YitT (DUF2179 family)